jgi:hypothetical protein
MTEGLLIYILVLMLFSAMLTIKLMCGIFLLLRKQLKSWLILWPASSVLSVWFILITIEEIYKVAGKV